MNRLSPREQWTKSAVTIRSLLHVVTAPEVRLEIEQVARAWESRSTCASPSSSEESEAVKQRRVQYVAHMTARPQTDDPAVLGRWWKRAQELQTQLEIEG